MRRRTRELSLWARLARLSQPNQRGDILFVAGAVCLCAGVALYALPAGLIVAGVLLLVCAVGYTLGEQ